MLDPKFGDLFARQASATEDMGSPFTAGLIRAMQADLLAGGPVARLLDGWKARWGDAVPIRLAGALHFAALSGRAPPLGDLYPQGRTPASPAALWPVARAYLERDQPFVAEFIKSPPQTNEVGRAIGLLLGFIAAGRAFGLPLRTLELGASAGLNLHWASFSYRTASWRLGDGPVMIETAWSGAPPEAETMPKTVSCAGCDLNPLDLANSETRTRLRSYLWADQIVRLRRFDAAVALALKLGAQVDKESADLWLDRKLAEMQDGTCTVVYHSLFFMYPPAATQNNIRDLIEDAGRKATRSRPLAWLRYEPEHLFAGSKDGKRLLLDLVTWPGGEQRVLADVDNTGRWVKRCGG